MRRTTVVGVFSVLLILFMLVACTTGPAVQTSEDVTTEAAEVQEDQAPTVTVWASTGPEGDALAQMAAIYENETGNRVNVNLTSRNVTRDQIRNALLGGSSEPDAMLFISRDMLGYAIGGFLEPLNDRIQAEDYNVDDIPELLWPEQQWEGTWYMAPTDVSQETLVYRSDLIDEPPETYDDLLELILDFSQSQNPDSPTRYGYAFSAGPNITEASWMGILKAHGGLIFDEAGNVGVDSPEAIETWQWLLDLKCELETTPPDITAWDYPEILTGLQEGVLAAASFFNAGMPVLYDCEQTPDLCGQFTYAPMPAGPDGAWTRTQTLGLAINANSNRKDAAWEFIKFVTGPEGAMQYTLHGGTSPRSSVLLDSEMQEQRPWTAALLEATERPALRPKHEKSQELLDILHEWQSRSLVCEIDAEEALTSAAAEMRELLNE